jgi:hypothetical protein
MFVLHWDILKLISPLLHRASIKLIRGLKSGLGNEFVAPLTFHFSHLKSVYDSQVSLMLMISKSLCKISIILIANYCLKIRFLSEFPVNGILLIFYNLIFRSHFKTDHIKLIGSTILLWSFNYVWNYFKLNIG